MPEDYGLTPGLPEELRSPTGLISYARTHPGGIHALFRRASPQGQASALLGQAQDVGLFNPLGSPRIRELMRRRALANYYAGRRRAGILSQLYGLDPSQRLAALANQDIAGHGELSSEISNADYAELTANRPFLQSLYGQQLSYAQQRELEKIRAQQQTPAALGGLAGQAGAAVIGHYLPSGK